MKSWPRKEQITSFGAVKGLGDHIDALEKAKPAPTIQGSTPDQLRAIVREELDRTKLGGK